MSRREKETMASSSCSEWFQMLRTLGAIAHSFEFSLLVQDLLPDIEVAGNAWFAIRHPLLAGEKNQQRGALRNDAAAAKESGSGSRNAS